MKDIDEIVLGKNSINNTNHEKSDSKECVNETSQSIYYWNTTSNDGSWNPSSTIVQNYVTDKSTK